MFDRQAIRKGKLAKVRQAFGEGKVIVTGRTVELLETVIEPGNRIILEGDNQKQGDFLARLAELQADARPVGAVSGMNYSRGRKVHVTVYRVAQLRELN